MTNIKIVLYVINLAVYVSAGWLVIENVALRSKEDFLKGELKIINNKLAKVEIERSTMEARCVYREAESTTFLLNCIKKLIKESEREAIKLLEERKNGRRNAKKSNRGKKKQALDRAGRRH